ncbi:MarR family transcriptional regulator [Fusibacter bizertensis]|uniref:MarR family transcriptional regulator n=1 Tax=Fusibacter bizertensis TaxID=1488331 RepID=A0ABT6NH26_9FIRM|nr:MarR family transcriptional regulator [Fusibacter bizertensis]MDH8679719.1 MarR family transcriptional regulator [Fusibacter bizertensis]
MKQQNTCPEIGVKKDGTLSDFSQLGKLISILNRAGQSFFAHQTSDFDIGGGQLSLIFYLYKHNGASQDELSRALEVDKATITRSVHKLEKEGIVKRQRDEQDHRVNRIVLTEAGFSIQNELKGIALLWHDTLLEGFSNDEIVQLELLFGKLLKNARNYKNSQLK